MMETVFLIHLLITTTLFVVAMIATKLLRNPHLRHAIWALLLLKMITPPVALFNVPELSGSPVKRTFTQALGQDPGLGLQFEHANDRTQTTQGNNSDVQPILETTEKQSPKFSTQVSDSVYKTQSGWHARFIILVIWVVGGLIYIGVVARHFLHFRGLLCLSTDASPETLERAEVLRSKLGLKKCPLIREIDAPVPPLVWSFGFKPIILLPVSLFESLDSAQRDAIILHELCHVRRYDFIVRWLETITIAIFWWNPIVWQTRCRLREAEEQCCDAMVVWARPRHRRSYGLALLQTNEFLANQRQTTPVATAFGGSIFKRRIEMIMKSHMDPKMSRLAFTCCALIACIVLPIGGAQSSIAQHTSNHMTESGQENSAADGLNVDAQANRKSDEISEKIAIIKQVCEANGILVTSKDIDARIQKTANQFEISTEKFVGLVTSKQGISIEEFKSQMVWPMVALEKLSQIKNPKALVPVVEEYLKRLDHGPDSQPFSSNTPNLSPKSGSSQVVKRKSKAELQLELNYLRAKVKFLEFQLLEAKAKER